MDFKTIEKIALDNNYELISTMDGKGYMLIPINNPHCMWDSFKTLEDVFAILKSPKGIEKVVENKKTHYYINGETYYSLKDNAKCLNDLGFNVLVFGAKKGERHCLVFCKNKKINLENIILHTNKKMGFVKFTRPFEKKWSGYYSAKYIK